MNETENQLGNSTIVGNISETADLNLIKSISPFDTHYPKQKLGFISRMMPKQKYFLFPSTYK